MFILPGAVYKLAEFELISLRNGKKILSCITFTTSASELSMADLDLAGYGSELKEQRGEIYGINAMN